MSGLGFLYMSVVVFAGQSVSIMFAGNSYTTHIRHGDGYSAPALIVA